MNAVLPFDQAATLLPFGLRQVALAIPKTEQAVAEELRLRAGRPLSVTFPDGESVLPGAPGVSAGDLRTVLEIATQASAHTALDKVRHGFVTVRGGHRVGLCGTAVVKEGEIHNLRELSSVNIRIARQVKGVGDEVLRRLTDGGSLPSTLVVSPPGGGKTTLLRDMIRGISSGAWASPLRVGVADERGELAALYDGVPQMDLGPHPDVMDGCPKAAGLMMLLRGMNPQVLAADEITAPQDVKALEAAAGCGVTLLATAHACGLDDLRRRPIYRRVLAQGIFQRVVWIDRPGGQRRYRVETLERAPC